MIEGSEPPKKQTRTRRKTNYKGVTAKKTSRLVPRTDNQKSLEIQMTDERLKNCPYCGSQTRLSTRKKWIGKACSHLYQSTQIKCKKEKSCGMSGPLFKGEDSRERCKNHWNRCTFVDTSR